MKALPIFLLGAALTALALPARAQQPAGYDPALAAREYARIEAERRQARTRFESAEADCYQRFAVNDCLRDVRRSRRVVYEELRRQEIILNDQRRASAAASQLQRTDDRAAELDSAQEQQQREESQRAYEERQEQARRKQAEREQRERELGQQQVEPAAASGAVEPLSADRPSAAEAQGKQRDYEEKLRQARERQKAYEKEKAARSRSSRPLPVPPEDGAAR